MIYEFERQDYILETRLMKLGVHWDSAKKGKFYRSWLTPKLNINQARKM